MVARVMGTHAPARLINKRATQVLTRPEATTATSGSVGQIDKVAVPTRKRRHDRLGHKAGIMEDLKGIRRGIRSAEKVVGHLERRSASNVAICHYLEVVGRRAAALAYRSVSEQEHRLAPHFCQLTSAGTRGERWRGANNRNVQMRRRHESAPLNPRLLLLSSYSALGSRTEGGWKRATAAMAAIGGEETKTVV